VCLCLVFEKGFITRLTQRSSSVHDRFGKGVVSDGAIGSQIVSMAGLPRVSLRRPAGLGAKSNHPRGDSDSPSTSARKRAMVSVPTATPMVASNSRISRSDAPFCRSSMMPSFIGIQLCVTRRWRWRECTPGLVEALRACCDVCDFAHTIGSGLATGRKFFSCAKGRASLIKTLSSIRLQFSHFGLALVQCIWLRVVRTTEAVCLHTRMHEVLST
jgi:hypothetical protein